MKRSLWIIVIGAAVVLAILAAWQFAILQKAHRSFADYAAFRGCVAITSRSDASGTCTLANGETITLVKSDGRWFLEGDLPWGCLGNFCYGL